MISASSALTATNSATGSLDYINSLITGATEQGSYVVWVDGRVFNDQSAEILRTTHGYRVTKSFNDMGTFPTYKIQWDPPYSPNITPMTAIFFSSDVYGGARWFYAMMDFNAGQIVGLVDTGLNISDYNLWNIYPLQNKGYVAFFGGSDVQMLCIDSSGAIAHQYSGSTNYDYDDLDGQWIYWDDQNNRVVRAFNGTSIYTLNYESYQDFYVDWDWDGASNGGAFQYTLYDDNAQTDSIRLVKSDATMVQLELYDLSYHYHNAYVYMNLIVLEKRAISDGQRLEYKIFNDEGTLLETIDVSSGSYYNRDTNFWGNSNFNVILYNGSDDSVYYRIITYEKSTGTLINETHERGSNYGDWRTWNDSWGMYPNRNLRPNIYIAFYDDSNQYDKGGFLNFGYFDLYYVESGSTIANLEIIQNTGIWDKTIGLYNTMDGKNLMLPFVDVDGYIKFTLCNSTGNVVRSSGILYSDMIDAGWTNEIGDYYQYTIQTNDGSNNVRNLLFIKYDNSEFYSSDQLDTGYYNDYSYHNIFVYYNSSNDNWYYFNSSSNGLTYITGGTSINVYDNTHYYSTDNIAYSNVVLYYGNTQTCDIITENDKVSNIQLPSNNSFFDIEVMKDYFVYLYMDSSSNNLIAKAYDLTGTEVNSHDTGLNVWAEGIGSAENRYWFSHYTNGGQMLKYHLFDNNTHDETELSNHSTSWSIDDIVWWN